MRFDPNILKLLQVGLAADRRTLIIRSAVGRDDASEYSFGIEEEYFLAHESTLEVAIQTPNELFEAANWSTGGQAMREMLQAQLEVATNIHLDSRDAMEELKFLRREVDNVASQYGLTIMACGTHPTAIWRQSRPSPKPRYEAMIEDLRTIGHRNMLCGMHVHVQLPKAERRFAVMQAMIPYIPLFIALATSSPFWNSKESGLKGYRLAAYDELPRTGLPEAFQSPEQYDEYVDTLKLSGVIPDESYIWWAIRSSSKHPTVELRAPDVCTSVDDAIAIASLYRALARHFYERPALLEPLGIVDRAIAVENKWRAQRYGTDCVFATKDGPVQIGSMLNAVIEQISEDASILGCAAEVENCKAILERGSSADQQLRVYRKTGDSISAVAKWIAATTVPDRMRREAPPWHEAVI